LVEVVGLGFSCSPFFSVYDLVVAGVVGGRGNRRGWAVEGGRGGGPGAGFQAAVGTADRGPRRAGAAERSDAGGPRWVRGFARAIFISMKVM
jgi:hypothetical protein